MRGADGNVRSVHAGEGLQFGDSFQTGEKGSARVAFEQGVQVLLPPGVILRVGEESVVGPAGGLDVPLIEIEQGEVRLLVESDSAATDDAGGPPRPLKLLVRTKAAVIGVRGTDFIVTVGDDKTGVHMVKGSVDLATDARSLGMSHSIPVGQFEGTEAVAGRPLPQPEHYDVGTFIREFHDRHSRLEALWNAAVRDAKTHGLRAGFLKLRTIKVDQVNMQNGFAPTAVRKEAEERDEENRKWKLRESGQQDEGKPGTHRKRRTEKKKVTTPDPTPSGTH